MGTITRKGFLRAGRNLLIGGAASALGLGAYVDFERKWFKIQGVEMRFPNLPASFDGLRLVHLSDLHVGGWLTVDRWAEVVDLVNQQDPDLIAITGDFIDHDSNRASLPRYAEHLLRLSARIGKFSVLGNHDHWESAGLVRQLLFQTGFVDLENTAYPIRMDGDEIYICGLDDYMENKQDLAALKRAMPEDKFSVLLVHEPDFADTSAASERFHLQLSGHSHGGQIFVPGKGPIVVPDLGQKYPRGLYLVEQMLLWTTTGVGMVQPYVRLNCRPEIAVITLKRGGE